jgi:hypothetical protein
VSAKPFLDGYSGQSLHELLAMDDADERLGELDDEFFMYPDPIGDRLLAFIRSNTADIGL